MNQDLSVADSNQGGATVSNSAQSNPAQSIVVVCSAGENYAMPMAVMLYSVMTNLNPHSRLTIYILDHGIRATTKRKVVQSLISERVTIEWIQLNRSLFTHLALTRYLTIAAYYRLLIPQVLPAQIDKAIYLNCDLMVNGDLSKLWQLDLGKNYVLAVQDYSTAVIPVGSRDQQRSELNLAPQPAPQLASQSFNSGLLVINLAQWRMDQVGPKVLEFCRQNQELIRNPDQDGLNAVLQGRWGALDAGWNQMPQLYTYSSWQDSPYDEATYRALFDRPEVIHYANAPKPWQHGCQHPAKHLFYHYLDQTAWTGWRDSLWRRTFRRARKGSKKLVRLISRRLKS